LLGAFITYDFSIELPSNWSFSLITCISLDEHLRLMDSVTKFLIDKSHSKTKIFDFVNQHRETIVLLITSLFSSGVLFSSPEFVTLDSVRNRLSTIMLKICHVESDRDSIELEIENIPELLSLWIYLIQKICFLFHAYDYYINLVQIKLF
jgi:hypothetical protein